VAEDYPALRARMVERQLRRRGIDDERVLAAMGEVPRERFVPGRLRGRAYSDSALPIGGGQTISQPWIVAAICQSLRLEGGERVLEVGSGSGYSACVLARLAREVIGIELVPALAERARGTIRDLGFTNVELIVGDGSGGLPARAPFDAIAIHAAAPDEPRALLDQLADGGRLVAPIAAGNVDLLTAFEREGSRFPHDVVGPCRFVPLLGAEGFGPEC
jgi:protein-L-isoaspartate(D-aspartate) O-methyltransferase